MALSASDSLATFDQTAKKLDLSPVLAAILVRDTALLGEIGMGEQCNASDTRFNEDALNPQTLTGDDALDASGTAASDGQGQFDVTDAADAAKIRVGALIMDKASGKSEVMQVTGISTTKLTVTRGYGSSNQEAHANAATYVVIGMPVQEGDETIADISTTRSQVTMYTQIAKRTIKVSGTQEAEAANGIHPGIPSEQRYQIMLRTDEMKVEINRAIIHSVISSSAGSDTVYRTMKGMREFLMATGANKRTTAEALSERILNLMYQDCWIDGGDPETLVGHPDQIGQVGSFNAQRLRVGPSDRVAGVFVSHFLTALGRQLMLLNEREMKSDELALIQKAFCYYSPLKGRTLFVEPLAKVGDANRWQILMEGALVVKNATKRHAYHTSLSVPAS